MKKRIIKDFLLIAIFIFFVINISYGQGPKEGASKVTVTNKTGYQLFMAFEPSAGQGGGQKRSAIKPESNASLDLNTKNGYLKDDSKFHLGFTGKPKAGEVLQNSGTMFWAPTNGHDDVIELVKDDQKISFLLKFIYNPGNNDVQVIIEP